MITRRPLNSSRMPALRAGAAAGLAAFLLASDLVLLTLFLNPEVTLRGDAWALLTSLLLPWTAIADRKSTRLNSSHANISYAVFCLKKKKQTTKLTVLNDRSSMTQ